MAWENEAVVTSTTPAPMRRARRIWREKGCRHPGQTIKPDAGKSPMDLAIEGGQLEGSTWTASPSYLC